MSVVLNEAAITALLNAPQGPVMRDIEERAQRAAVALQVRIDGIMEGSFVKGLAGYRMTPEGAVVGIEDTGRVADYLDEKLGIRENWWLEVGEEAASGS